MKAFDQEDAQLDLEQGQPRFYIMRLPAKPSGLSFTQITHHKKVTQCLGSVTPEPWCAAPNSVHFTCSTSRAHHWLSLASVSCSLRKAAGHNIGIVTISDMVSLVVTQWSPQVN